MGCEALLRILLYAYGFASLAWWLAPILSNFVCRSSDLRAFIFALLPTLAFI